jgi:hypothetical protein
MIKLTRVINVAEKNSVQQKNFKFLKRRMPHSALSVWRRIMPQQALKSDRFQFSNITINELTGYFPSCA